MKRVRLALALTVVTLTAAEARPLKGYYSVPVANDLEASAIYPVVLDGTDYERGGPRRIDFPLPVELTGKPVTIAMEQVGDTETWKGENVEGVCGKIGRELSCEVRFKGLEFDPEAARAAIDLRFPDRGEADRRMSVMRTFSAEPHGFIVYRLRGRDRERGPDR